MFEPREELRIMMVTWEHAMKMAIHYHVHWKRDDIVIVWLNNNWESIVLDIAVENNLPIYFYA